ncbi:hypothetical protein B2J93_9042 [Marssonina coronariae]|uniref:Uncharacterized protein n=1 Tax=Diplocarpon coronariae TaxID=2795749 RepID=A0A218ZIV5_9HELO|nr:hypothetical protein B2J93_9042 [Marssonina coronariae]
MSAVHVRWLEGSGAESSRHPTLRRVVPRSRAEAPAGDADWPGRLAFRVSRFASGPGRIGIWKHAYVALHGVARRGAGAVPARPRGPSRRWPEEAASSPQHTSGPGEVEELVSRAVTGDEPLAPTSRLEGPRSVKGPSRLWGTLSIRGRLATPGHPAEKVLRRGSAVGVSRPGPRTEGLDARDGPTARAGSCRTAAPRTETRLRRQVGSGERFILSPPRLRNGE